jgi:hypothetical protein
MKETNQNNRKELSIREHLIRECDAMAKYAFASGLSVPGPLMESLEATKNMQSGGINKLTSVHERLAQIVAPATPRTILLLHTESEKEGVLNFLGPVPLIRRMMLASILSLIMFVTLSLSPDVSRTGGGILDSSGMELLLNELFYLSAAGLGASFGALFMANRYITEGTFDPKYESSYWIRFALGLIAGIILAEVITLVSDLEGGGLAKPALAMVGGFSAALVYRILNRLVETIESLFRGETREIIASKEQAAKTRYEDQLSQSRLKTATNLIHLQQQLDSGNPEQVKQNIKKILNELMPAGIYEEESQE